MIALRGRDLRHSLAKRERYLARVTEAGPAGVVLSTCDRVEVYQGDGDIPVHVAAHLFRVVSGLESALPGETAIQGQVKNAYERARAAAALSPQLHKLFQRALLVGKRVRSETAISRGAMSHGKAVIEILRQDAVDIPASKIVIIGVNHLNQTLVKYLAEQGAGAVFIANRTYEKAAALGRAYGCAAVRFTALSAELCSADIVVSATSSPHAIIRRGDVITGKHITMFDLAVPRDIDPAIGTLPRVTLYNIEDIEARISGNRDRRLAEARKAEKIIEEELRVLYAGQ